MKKYNIRLGYACINTELRQYDIFPSRGLTLETLKNRGVSLAKEKALDNIDDTVKIILWNEQHGIRFYRLTSNLFPHMENPLAVEKYTIDFATNKLKFAGKLIKKLGHRISMHPGQFVQLGSINKNVVKQSIKDLTLHASILLGMKLTPKDGSVLIIHGGGAYGDKETTLKRFINNFKKLPKSVSQFIVLENDEFTYGINDILPLCEKNNIPFCLDVFHNSISKDKIEITTPLLKRVFNTWHKRGIPPKMHLSEQQAGLKLGAHSKSLHSIPKYLLQIPNKFKMNLDIMLEVKDKEQSVLRMYKKYFDRTISNNRIEYVLKNKYSS